jgi:thioredoxin 1
MAENVPEVNEREFNEFIKKGLVFVDFFAEWCMPCMMMSPIIDDLSKKFDGKIKFCKINVSDNEMLARKFNISSIPNFTIFRDGKVINQFVGALGEEELENRLRRFVE